MARKEEREERRTPDGWLAQLRTEKPPRRHRVHDYEVQHAMASTSHGWSEHRHHVGQGLLMTRSDYEAALASTQTATLEPHGPAKSPFKKG